MFSIKILAYSSRAVRITGGGRGEWQGWPQRVNVARSVPYLGSPKN